MKSVCFCFITFLILLFSSSLFAQEKGKVQDTTKTKIVKEDPNYKEEKKEVPIYKNIEKISKKSKLGRLLHKTVFQRPDPKNSKVTRKHKKHQYKSFEGKIIRNIYIQTLDPFGFSVQDTTKKPKNWAEKAGNHLHLKSKEFAIRNLTLLKKNTPLDSLLVRETERLIRNQRFVSQVQITAQLTQKNSDSVDVTVRVLDSWSIIPKGSISPTRNRFELIDRNFFGTGNEFSNRIITEKGNDKTAFASRLMLPTIKSTYIRTRLEYRTELDGSYGKSANIERRFFSPYTKWAGGFYVDQQFKKDSLPDSSGKNALQNFKYNSQDLWAGRSFQLFAGRDEAERSTNLIVASRFLHTGYTETPTIAYDPTHFYSGENFLLANIGISSRQFVEDQYLFNYGIIEDVPIGKVYSITSGYQRKNHSGRLYFGAKASFGDYFNFGYISSNIEYGTFVTNKKMEQSALSIQANYFTNLMPIGDRWKMRQFVKPQLVLGWNRLNIKDDRISINENSSFQGEYGAGINGTNNFGIRGYDANVYGTKKIVLSLQTQFYSPWDLWGFRVNPYFNFTTALLGSEKKELQKSPLYSSVVIGIIISNDYLVFNSFQFSLAYYPSIPGQGTNIFNTNSFETADFGFQDFELGKPQTVLYQ